MPSARSRKLVVVATSLLSLTVAFTFLSAFGTVCVAWNAEQWDSFSFLAPYEGVYQTLVYSNLVAATLGAILIYALIRGRSWSYAGALAILVVFLLTAVVQMYYSSTLGQVSFFSTPPTSIRFYMTAAVLAFFLGLRVPRIWGRAGLSLTSGGNPNAAVGFSLVVGGLIVATTLLWASSSHMVDGYSLLNVLELPLILGGVGLMLAGSGLLVLPTLWSKTHQSVSHLKEYSPLTKEKVHCQERHGLQFTAENRG